MTSHTPPFTLTVLFDGGCPMCRREIAHYQRLPPAIGRGGIDWVDIDADPDAAPGFGIPQADAMARLHAIDAAGQVHTGVAAFVAIWLRLRRYRWLGRGIRALRLTRPLEFAYQRFAAWRLRRRQADAAHPIPPSGGASPDQGTTPPADACVSGRCTPRPGRGPVPPFG